MSSAERYLLARRHVPGPPLDLSGDPSVIAYRLEKQLAAERQAPEKARRDADLKATWDRDLAAALRAQKGGRPKSVRDIKGGFA